MKANGLKTVRENCAMTGRVAAPDLREEAGISYRQLDYWCRTGLLEYEGGVGSGSYRTFARVEVSVAEMLGRLSRAGLAANSHLARRVATAIRSGRTDIVSDGPLSVFIA